METHNAPFLKLVGENLRPFPHSHERFLPLWEEMETFLLYEVEPCLILQYPLYLSASPFLANSNCNRLTFRSQNKEEVFLKHPKYNKQCCHPTQVFNSLRDLKIDSAFPNVWIQLLFLVSRTYLSTFSPLTELLLIL